MNRKLRKSTQRWLEAERQGSDGAAEDALARVFRALPTPRPSAALTSRTLARLGLVDRVASKPHWAYRWAVSVALAVSGLAVASLAPALASSLDPRLVVDWLVDAGAGFLVVVSSRLAVGYTFWDVVAGAGATVADVVVTPQMMGLMLITVLFGMATLRALAGLVAFEGSSNHA